MQLTAHDKSRPTAPDVLTFEHVTFGYTAQPVVEDISFSVERGEFFALVGPNGGGKTTVLKLALGLLKPHHGTVSLWGAPVAHFTGWQRLAYVPQRIASMGSQFPGTVEEVASYGLYRGMDPLALLRSKPSQAVREALEIVGMWEHRDKRLVDLSMGQQQRVLIARALVKKPELVLLDEPTSGVDMPAQQQFHELLKELNQRMSLTIVLVSHDVGAVMQAATQIGCIAEKLVYHGPASQFPLNALPTLYGAPVHPIEHHHD